MDIAESIAETMAMVDDKPATAGTCTVSASFNLNMGNFETLKINVGFSESYTGIDEDTREAKYQQLKELVNEKFQDLTIDYAKNAKGLSTEIHKYFNGKRSKGE